MTIKEKINELKNTIIYLYEKEGRSKSYISRILEIPRKELSIEMNNWELIKADVKYLTPSNQKFLNKNKDKIIRLLKENKSISNITTELNINRSSLIKTFIKNDKELLHEYNLYKQRIYSISKDKKCSEMNKSSRIYEFEEINGENWKPILGYEQYEISDYGRVRKYAKIYKKYFLIQLCPNINNKRYYVRLSNKERNGNYAVHKLVANAFVEKPNDGKKYTVDHLNGNVLDNRATNLEWVSQSENNKRAFTNGKTPNQGYQKHGKFKAIVVDNKYEFKTIRAVAKFLGLSETQTVRQIDGKAKSIHTFKFIY